MSSAGDSEDAKLRASRRRRASPSSNRLDGDNQTDAEDHKNSDTLVPVGIMPSYLAEIFGELYHEDGLVVLGRGLQANMLLAAFVRFYADTQEGHWAIVQEEEQQKRQEEKMANNARHGRRLRPLVLVLGLSRETERSTLLEILTSWGTPPEMLPTILTNESGSSAERASLYKAGGVFVVTSRILIVDLLTSVIQAKDIDGILVANAEQVVEASTEAFILRIIQSQRQLFSFEEEIYDCPPAFCKAISENPEKLMSDFGRVDKVLKALYVRRLYLYPRFHAIIREELEGKNPPVVIELHQDLSPAQKEMQQAIAAAVLSCVRELKTSAPKIDWTQFGSDSSTSIEAILTMDRKISNQLENDWHRLAPKAKQLVQDLRTLRTLFQNLLLYDCVSFYRLLISLQAMSAASRYPSLWLLSPAAEVLFSKAKERVYRIHRPVGSSKTNRQDKNEPHQKEQQQQPLASCQPVLEENPKWRLLRQVLMEIRDDYKKKQREKADAKMEESSSVGPKNILIMVKDDRTLDTVRDYLLQGRRTIWLRWLRYLEQYNDRSRSKTNNTAAISEESRLLLEEESRARRILFGKERKRSVGKDAKKPAALNQVPDYVRKRRRIAIEKGRGVLTHQADDLEREAVLDEAVERTEHEMMATRSHGNEEEEENDVSVEDHLFGEDKRFLVSFPNELRVVIKSYTSTQGDQASLLLQDLKPTHVVLYDAEVSFVRAVEVFAALSTGPIPLRVYFLLFAASAEEKSFLKSLQREQDAFERLIQHKKTMPLPVLYSSTETQEMQQAREQGVVAGTYLNGTQPLSLDTRTGRGKTRTSKDRRDIAVDVREFRSALPSVLHQEGMRLAPVTLTVGDFVLSNVHCVERKSISDLFGSFASGRLYTQAEAMVKHYKVPCLLIEFDPRKTFSLQNANELGVEIRTDSICSKIALLAMHFPQLRILWSRSPLETVKIFKALKKNHDEVDVDKAVEIGRNESEELLLRPDGKESEEDEINEGARDMLLRLPGVNSHIARKIMQNCDSLAELIEMSREELRRIAGPVTGQKLFTFFRQKITAADAV